MWDLVRPGLERRHDVLAPALAGHVGGPELDPEVGPESLIGAAERALDEAGLETAHLVGNSLGGYVALVLAARGRARSVVALAPGGGWKAVLDLQERLLPLIRASAAHVDAIVATPDGRRRVSQYISERFEHIPVELLSHLTLAGALCPGAETGLRIARRHGWPYDASNVTCPVRIIWGTEDKLLPWPQAAERFERELPQADWVVLGGVGHCPQLDMPLETSELILGWTSR